MDKIEVINIFAAVFEKSVLDAFLDMLDKQRTKFWGTEGTIKYVQKKGFEGESVVKGFDYSGRVKSLDRANFVRILADKNNPEHLEQLKKEGLEPFDLVIVDLYAPDESIFPESMDIGGQTLVRSAIKNYQSVALAYDERSIEELILELNKNAVMTSLEFRKEQAKKASRFIAQRCKLESELLDRML
jgi:phosphoribosylaminoimidazolecarboxamide formyltransferase/IMP cyclohydrolase